MADAVEPMAATLACGDALYCAGPIDLGHKMRVAVKADMADTYDVGGQIFGREDIGVADPVNLNSQILGLQLVQLEFARAVHQQLGGFDGSAAPKLDRAIGLDRNRIAQADQAH